MDENMAADVLTGTDASAKGADFDGLFDMDGGEVTAEPQETEGQEGAAETQEPEADPAEGTGADAQPGRQEQPGAEPARRYSNPEDHRAAGLCRPQNCRIKQKSPGGCRGSLSLSCICWLL